MKRFINFFLVAIAFLSAQAQIAWPPKNFPCNVPFILPAEIEYYWGIKSIICTGKSGNGYKFKVTGTGNHDHAAAQIDMLYMRPAVQGGVPKAEIAGTYYFPQVEKGKSFYFDFVSAWAGSTPKSFSLFFMNEWITIPNEEIPTGNTNTSTSLSDNRSETTASSGNTLNQEPVAKANPVY